MEKEAKGEEPHEQACGGSGPGQSHGRTCGATVQRRHRWQERMSRTRSLEALRTLKQRDRIRLFSKVASVGGSHACLHFVSICVSMHDRE